MPTTTTDEPVSTAPLAINEPLAPIALIFQGQSNANGKGDATQSPVLPPPVAMEWTFKAAATPPAYGTGHWLDGLRDPMNSAGISSQKSLTGSLVPALCRALNEATGRQLLVSHLCQSQTGLYCAPGNSIGNTWQPVATGLYTNAKRKAKAMLATPEGRSACDTWIVVTGQEQDAAALGANPTTFLHYPDGMIVDYAVDPAGNVVSYPNGYPSPNGLVNAYTLIKEYYAALLADFPGAGLLINMPGYWRTTAANLLGSKMIHPIIRRVVADLQAAGKRIILEEATLTFQEAGYLARVDTHGVLQQAGDGVHYNQDGLNYLGQLNAGDIAANLQP